MFSIVCQCGKLKGFILCELFRKPLLWPRPRGACPAETVRRPPCCWPWRSRHSHACVRGNRPRKTGCGRRRPALKRKCPYARVYGMSRASKASRNMPVATMEPGGRSLKSLRVRIGVSKEKCTPQSVARRKRYMSMEDGRCPRSTIFIWTLEGIGSSMR